MKTINSIEQDLKKAGFSPKDIQQVKDDINQISIPKDGTENPDDDPRVKELKDLIEKAKGDRENAEKAREQRDAAVKAAEEAQEAARKAQETANSIADQTSKAAKEAAWMRVLQKLQMTEGDMEKYREYRNAVSREIRELRVVLESLEAKKNDFC